MHISPVLWQFLVRWLTNSALFPPEASAISPYMDAFYFFLIAISAVGMIAVIILVFGFSIMYRQEKNPVATQIEGSTLLEATWTIIPLALFMICFVWGALLYFRIYDPPTNAMNIYIVGKQWMWKAEHPGGQHEIDSLHGALANRHLCEVALEKFHADDVIEVAAFAGDQVVDDPHLMAAPDQLFRQMGTDETGAAGHEV